MKLLLPEVALSLFYFGVSHNSLRDPKKCMGIIIKRIKGFIIIEISVGMLFEKLLLLTVAIW